jgi:hypothetical protein
MSLWRRIWKSVLRAIAHARAIAHVILLRCLIDSGTRIDRNAAAGGLRAPRHGRWDACVNRRQTSHCGCRFSRARGSDHRNHPWHRHQRLLCSHGHRCRLRTRFLRRRLRCDRRRRDCRCLARRRGRFARRRWCWSSGGMFGSGWRWLCWLRCRCGRGRLCCPVGGRGCHAFARGWPYHRVTGYVEPDGNCGQHKSKKRGDRSWHIFPRCPISSFVCEKTIHRRSCKARKKSSRWH